MVKSDDRTLKQVQKNAALFGMEVTLYTDTVNLVNEKCKKWLNI